MKPSDSGHDPLGTVFIPSKGRPECLTARTLDAIGYPGESFIVCEEGDPDLPGYIANFGDGRVLTFDHAAATGATDLMDDLGDAMPSGVAPARNAICAIARSWGLRRCWQLDDDASGFWTGFDGDWTEIGGDDLHRLMRGVASYADSIGAVTVGVAGFAWPPFEGQRPIRACNSFMNVSPGIRWTGRQAEDSLLAWRTFLDGGVCLAVPFAGAWVGFRRAGSGRGQTGGCAGLYEETEERFGSFIGQASYETLVNPTLWFYLDEDGETRSYPPELDFWNPDANVPCILREGSW